MYWVKNQSANISVKMNKCQIQQKWNKDENQLACQKPSILKSNWETPGLKSVNYWLCI